jgi:hypothetical protein
MLKIDVLSGPASTANGESDLEKTQMGETLGLGLIFGLAVTLFHVAINLRGQHLGYGFFRDELYYLICGRHLDWGYVDHPPLVALATRFSELVFGLHSLALFRLLPSLAGGLEVAGVALLARDMGGGRSAQMLAMVGVATCPLVLAIDAFLSMNCFEPLFWIGTVFAVLRATRGGSRWWWMVAGAIAGLGFENKWNIVFFLFSMVPALLLTETRRKLNRWFGYAVAMVGLMALPNLLWQMAQAWPTLEWLHNTKLQGKNIIYSPGMFVWNQIFDVGPISAVIWVGGLVWLLVSKRARGVRWVGVLYAIYLPAMIVMHANDYYLAPVYPLLFAAGGVAWSQWLGKGMVRRLAMCGYAAVLVAYSLLGTAIVQPVLSPPEYVRLIPQQLKPKEFNAAMRAPVPELIADMTGWQEMANTLASAYLALPKEDRAKAAILTENYGEASAVTVLRPDVPMAISGHQNYWYWGPRGHTGEVMVVFGFSREELKKEYGSVTEVARTTNPWGHQSETGPVFVCRGAKHDLREAWPRMKHWL